MYRRGLGGRFAACPPVRGEQAIGTVQTVVLGALAGCTIFLGLPLGRIRGGSKGIRCFLNGVSAGILVFLLFDILENATGPVEDAVSAIRDGNGTWGRFAGLTTLYVAGLALGLLSLLYVGRLLKRREPSTSLGPGAMAVAETTAPRRHALRLGMSIAVGIGLHNFSEGLAIGQAARANEISLAVLLVVGFAAHNATEGFGIVGPLAAADVRASWRWLVLAGLIGGGPTFLGTLIGTAFSSTYVFVLFLTLAAGAILYVIGELFSAGRKMSWEITLWGILAGFLVAFATELIVVAAGV